MKNLLKIIFFLLLFTLSSLNKCWASDKVKIGLVVPLSGEYSNIGNTIVKSVRLAINKINNNNIVIVPKDSKANPIDTLKVSKELSNENVKIIIGPVFYENLRYLDELQHITFLSLTNKIINKPKNVISAGVNAISQLKTIEKFSKMKNLERSILMIPNTNYKNEIKNAVKLTNLKIKEQFVYDQDPTILTKQIEKLTRYSERKKKLEDKIIELEDSSLKKNKDKIKKLKKKDTLGFINFDSVIIADFDESLKSVATSLLYTDVSSKRISYITLNQWFDKTLLKESALQPIYFPSINRINYLEFINEYKKSYNSIPNQLSFLSYDLIGLIYFLLYEQEFKTTKNLFLKKNTFRGKIGIFEINDNIITHRLNFYSVENNKFIKIF